MHQFETRLVHPAEAAEVAKPSDLHAHFKRDMPESLLQTFLDPAYPPNGEMLFEALPFPGLDPESYRLHGAPYSGLLNKSDTIDLGNRLYEVCHLPGHPPAASGFTNAPLASSLPPTPFTMVADR